MEIKMKKLFVVSAVLAAMISAVSCNSTLDFNNPNDQNSQSSGTDNTRSDTGEIYGECYPNKTCNEGLVCDKDYNICIKDPDASEKPDTGKTDPTDTGDTGNTPTDTGDTGTDTGDTTTDTGDTITETCKYVSDTTEFCYDIFYCVRQNRSHDCIDACVATGTPEAQEIFTTMYNCWTANCGDMLDPENDEDEFNDCVNAHCQTETEPCSWSDTGPEGDTRYPAPYGTLQINVANTYLITNETQFDQSMVTMSSFASGELGGSDIVPAETQYSYNYAMFFDNGGQSYIEIVQSYTSDGGQTLINPMILIVIPTDISVGTVPFGLDSGSVGQMYVADYDYNSNSFSCYHGFGYGELTVTAINAEAGSAGKISMNGTIEIYSAANAPIYGGDITSQLPSDWVNCEPR